MAINTQMPQTQAPFVTLNDGRITQEWLYVLQILWANSGGGGGGGSGVVLELANISDLQNLTGHGDTTTYIIRQYITPGDGGGGIFVIDPLDETSDDNGGTIIVDADGNRWKRIYSGPVSVKWFGAVGDGLADDTLAIQAALDADVDVFVPAGDYLISDPLEMGDKQGRKFRGAGSLAATLYATGGDGPMIQFSTTIYYAEVSGFYLERLGTAVAGDEGIKQWVLLPSPVISDIVAHAQWNGIFLAAVDSGLLKDCYSLGNLNDGIRIQNLNTGPNAGQCQWLLDNVFSSANAQNGYHVGSTGVGPVGLALGTWANVNTFANSGHGIRLAGQPGQPINGFRVVSGFLGEDGASELYLDTYGGGHIVQLTYIELCGTGVTGPTFTTPASGVGAGIEITGNNTVVNVQIGQVTGNSYDGLISSCGYLTVTGGSFQNNGLAGNISRSNGIYLFDGTSASISGCRLGNSAGSFQKFGLASNVDCVAMAGCDLRFNTLSWYAFSGGLTVSQIAGCLPGEANTFSIPGDLTVGSLHVTGDAAFGGDIFMDGGGTFYNNTGGIVGLNIQALANVYGVNAVFSGDVDTQTLHVHMQSAFAGAINANTITGYFDGLVVNNLNVATSAFFANLSANTITAATDLISNGQLHIAGAAAFAGGLNVTNGGINLTAGVPGNGITADNLTVRVSAGVGTNATGVTGQLRVQNDIIALDQLHVIGQSAFNANMNLTGANTFFANSGSIVANYLQALNTVYGVNGDFSSGNLYAAHFIGGSFNGTTGVFSGNVSTAVLSPASINSPGNVTVGGSLNVTGASGFSGDLNAPGRTFYGLSVVVDVASVAPGAIYGPGGVPYTFP